MNTKELIMNINETKNRMRIYANNLNSSIIQTEIAKGPVIAEPDAAKLYKLTTDCIIDIYNLDKLCKLLESLSEEEKEKEL